jgi:heme exporter protein A
MRIAPAVRPISQLDVANLTCIRGERVLFRDLSFTAVAGRPLCIEGANGAGKTSLLRILAGFLAPAAGTIRLRMKDGDGIADADLRGPQIGFIGHREALKSQLTARENLAFYAALYRAAGDLDAALAWAGLARVADLPAQYLSAGQKKRVGLARLRLCARPLWLLDEPLAALDYAGKALVTAMIAEHCADGGIAIVATHEALDLDCAQLRLGPA